MSNNNFFDFGKVAHLYDNWFQTSVGRVYDRLETRALNQYMPSATQGDKLLDVGCGTGHFSRLFSKCGYQVHGIDISEKMIWEARNAFIPHASFEVADMMNIPYPDEYFEVAASIAAFEFIDYPGKALLEMLRCLKKGGTIIIAVLNKNSPLTKRRIRQGNKIFTTANLFTVEKLAELLNPLNNVESKASAFVLPYKGLVWSHHISEIMGKLCKWEWGDFIIGKAVK